jgi:hypothetical protein
MKRKSATPKMNASYIIHCPALGLHLLNEGVSILDHDSRLASMRPLLETVF